MQLREEASKSVALSVRSNQSKPRINVGLLSNCCSKRVQCVSVCFDHGDGLLGGSCIRGGRER